MQEPLIKILTITIGILHFVQEPLIIIIIIIIIIIKKILTITIGILHFVQEPLITFENIKIKTIVILNVKNISLYFFKSNKCSLGEHKKRKNQKHNLADTKLLNGSVYVITLYVR